MRHPVWLDLGQVVGRGVFIVYVFSGQFGPANQCHCIHHNTTSASSSNSKILDATLQVSFFYRRFFNDSLL